MCLVLHIHFNFEYFKQKSPTKLIAILNYFTGLKYRWINDQQHDHFNLGVRFCQNQGSHDIINQIKKNNTSITNGHSLDQHKIEDIPGYPQAVFANKKNRWVCSYQWISTRRNTRSDMT